MSDIQAFGTRRNTFFTGNNNTLLKHVCPPVLPEEQTGPLDPVLPNRRFRLNLMNRFDLDLPSNVANRVGTDELAMWVIRNRDADPDESFPSPLLRMVQGEIIHAEVDTSTDTHTIHWHGIEPTPMNDGVGKHSFEINGTFVYQFQPNEAGTYFYHCHKNTVLHFEMGLYGGLIVDPPAPAGSGLTAPYTTGGPGFVAGKLRAQDTTELLRYDIEKIWMVDDLDSRWHEPEPHHNHNMQDCNASNPVAPDTFYRYGDATRMGEFELNDFHPDIFTVSGVVMNVGSGPPFVGTINNTSIRIDAAVGQTVLLRYANAGYTIQELTLPVDATVIAWDGHPLGVGGFHRFSRPYVVPAGKPIRTTTARRFDIIINPGQPVSGMADIRYYEWIKGVSDGPAGQVQIPVNIV
ncbi:MAG: multicopper oxidase domain-containing protein [Desulfobacterales bacterium]